MDVNPVRACEWWVWTSEQKVRRAALVHACAEVPMGARVLRHASDVEAWLRFGDLPAEPARAGKADV